MNTETKTTYLTTALAGWRVAGQRIPPDGPGPGAKPKVGHPLELTEAQAKYELLSGSIERAPEAAGKVKKPAGDPPTGPAA